MSGPYNLRCFGRLVILPNAHAGVSAERPLGCRHVAFTAVWEAGGLTCINSQTCNKLVLFSASGDTTSPNLQRRIQALSD